VTPSRPDEDSVQDSGRADSKRADRGRVFEIYRIGENNCACKSQHLEKVLQRKFLAGKGPSVVFFDFLVVVSEKKVEVAR
jgi:hypothetical protein